MSMLYNSVPSELKTCLDPMMHLNVLECRIEMKLLNPILLFHIMAAGQLNVELHLCGANIMFPFESTQEICAIAGHIFISSCCSVSEIIIDAATRGDAYGAPGVSTCAWPISPFLKQLHFPSRLQSVYSLVLGIVLYVLRDKHLDTMTLDFGEGRKFERNWNLRTQWK